MTPHSLGYAEPLPEDSSLLVPGERHVYYYAERARGGVGLIIQEGSMVHRSSETGRQPRVSDPRSIPRLRRIVEVVHAQEAKIFLQLWHAGGHALNRLSMEPTLAPSQVPALPRFSIPKAMDEKDIEAVQAGFAQAARNAREAGYDGVELHAGTSYLIFQFLSPFYNKRKDRYGGPLENRMRFLLETIDCVRDEIGSGMALGLRFISAELSFGGLSLDEGIEIARTIERCGKVDFLDVEGVLTYHATPLTLTMYNPPHFNLDYIAPIKDAVSSLAILGNVLRLVDPYKAEEFIAGGKMDMVGGGRLFITDPDWADKARSGRTEDILSCIACNQYCFEHANAGLPIGCVINAAAGREKAWGHGTLMEAPKTKKVLVIGGGPAGLEAARVAALRGHQVRLYEKEQELGGQLLLAARLPGREVMATTIRWYETQLRKIGVQIVRGEEADRRTLASESPDAVVLAAGARYVRTGLSGFIASPVEGWEQNSVVTPEEVIRGKAKTGKSVLIYDDEGFVTALGLAQILVDEGKEVRIVTRYPFVGSNLVFNFQLHPLQARVAGRVKLIPDSFVKSFFRKRVVVQSLYTMEEEGIEPVDSLVMITSKESADELLTEIKESVDEFYAVGDCVSPRRLGEAIYDGHKVGRTL